MENVDLESENRSEFRFDDVASGSEAVRRVVKEIETVAPRIPSSGSAARTAPAGTHSIGPLWRCRVRSPVAQI